MTPERLQEIKENIEKCRAWMSASSMLIYQQHVDELITALEEANETIDWLRDNTVFLQKDWNLACSRWRKLYQGIISMTQAGDPVREFADLVAKESKE